MNAEPDLGRLAKTVGDASRVRMLVLLMEGRALTAKELAYGAGVEPATATSHLRRLLDDGLVSAVSQGRHKYFRLASADVARFVESMMALAPVPRRSRAGGLAAIHAARFCYDHLAGRLGTRLRASLVSRGVVTEGAEGFEVSAEGRSWLEGFGVDVAEARRLRRRFAPRCLDWSEREDHLAGSLGAAIAARLLGLDWIRRRADSRAVEVTPAGRRGLARSLGCSLTDEP